MNAPGKILLVDDEKATLVASRHVLEASGYEVRVAQDGTQALEQARTHRPDLILLDVHLPDISGYEVCRQIKNDPRLEGMFVIMFSAAHIDSDSQSEGLEGGADGYIARPIGNRELLARIRAMLRIRAAEVALRKKDAETHALYEAMTEMFALHELVYDPSGQAVDYRILDCNPAFERITGISRRQAIGMQASQLYSTGEAPYLDRYAPVAETGTPITFETEFAPIGKWLSISAFSPEKGRFATITSDITVRKQAFAKLEELLGQVEQSRRVLLSILEDRKQAEEALKQRAAQLLLLNDISRRVASVMDLDDLLDITASLIHESFGFDHVGIFIADTQQEGDLVMKARAGVYASRFPSDHRLKQGQGMIGWVALYGKKLLANDVSIEGRFSDPFDDGSIRAELSVPIRSELGTVGVIDVQSRQKDAFSENDMMVMETLADVLAVAMQNARLFQDLEAYGNRLQQAVDERTAELMRAKERVETILANSPDGIIFLNTHGLIEAANLAFSAMCGYSADEIYNKSLADLYDTAQARAVSAALADVLGTGQAKRVSLVSQRQNGTTFDADLALAPVKNNNGVTAVVCSIRDISALKEVERMKDAFVSNVSHELRTPIASLKLNQKLVALDPPHQDVYIGRIGREIDRLNTLIEDILRLSRLDQSQVVLKLEPVDIGQLAAQYVEDRAPLAENRQQTMVFTGLPEIPVVQADRGLLGQALSILITNALNYTPAGGQISVRTVMSSAEGIRSVGVTVSDSGPGIAPDDLDHLFERFYRGKVGRDSGFPGTGLGLAIAKEIVERHHGQIDISSEGIPGKGVGFTLWIPIESEE